MVTKHTKSTSIYLLKKQISILRHALVSIKSTHTEIRVLISSANDGSLQVNGSEKLDHKCEACVALWKYQLHANSGIQSAVSRNRDQMEFYPFYIVFPSG